MAIPTSYMTGSFSKISLYFDTMLTAKAPEKFTIKFMSDLGFTSSNDRQFVNVLKLLDFLTTPVHLLIDILGFLIRAFQNRW